MTPDQAPQTSGAARDSSNLMMRVLAGAVLAPLTIGLAYFGGWPWIVLVSLATVGMVVEWLTIVGAADRKSVVGGAVAALVLAGLCLVIGRLDAALGVIGVGLIAVAVLARDGRGWVVSGLLYAAAAQLATATIRQDPLWGFTALCFVLLVVWITDIGGYFAGRGFGGPKLWVRVSPKKTWAGAVGGFVGSLGVAAGFAASGLGRLVPLLLLAAVLSVASQLGDLFESAVKRRFGVKDSGSIIPGHGGLLDRLDGFVVAIVIAVALGVLRGGVDGAGRGLMIW